jgi:hypothetical protein
MPGFLVANIKDKSQLVFDRIAKEPHTGRILRSTLGYREVLKTKSAAFATPTSNRMNPDN